jgi:cyclopropane-fatty-acyl-phospholipid synthase
VDEALLEQKLAGKGYDRLEEENELYLAQLRKLDHIIEKLKIPSDRPIRILEIGSGWGSMAIRIAQRYPLATIDTLTLSVQQQHLAQQRVSLLGPRISDRITVHLMDYRAMPQEWEAAFDRVVSVEMIEAVGKEFLEVYWKTVDWAMKRENAAGVVQVITLPEASELGSLCAGEGWDLIGARDRV